MQTVTMISGMIFAVPSQRLTQNAFLILSQRNDQIFLNMVRHPLFDPKDLCSETFVRLLRRLKRPFEETAMHTYNLW